MSENSDNNLLIEEIKDLFLFLTEKEPTPDDEIEGQKTFITKFKLLKNMNAFPKQEEQIDKIISKLEEWDTLDQWFIETTIPTDINNLLKIKNIEDMQSDVGIIEKPESEEDFMQEKKLDSIKPDSSNIDINEIVSQVSEQFKGEIDTLKDTINRLKGELDKKDDSIQELKTKTNNKKITPKKHSKLPPLTIKLPVVKKPIIQESKKSKLDININTSSLTPIPENNIKEEPQQIEELQIFEEESINKQEKVLTPIPLKSSKKEEQELEIIPELKKQPEPPIIQEIPKITDAKSSLIKEQDSSTNDELLLFDDGTPQKKEVSPPVKKRSLITTMAIEEPLVKDIQKEKVEKKTDKTGHITQVEIKETDTEKKKTSGSDLFGVFSPYREDKSKKKKKKKPSSGIDVLIPSNQQESNYTEQESSINTNNKSEIKNSLEDLPKDKDSLYQELIALEGKRYSLEKEFKESERKYEKGQINENKFKDQTFQLKIKLDEITSRITGIRRIISSL